MHECTLSCSAAALLAHTQTGFKAVVFYPFFDAVFVFARLSVCLLPASHKSCDRHFVKIFLKIYIYLWTQKNCGNSYTVYKRHIHLVF